MAEDLKQIKLKRTILFNDFNQYSHNSFLDSPAISNVTFLEDIF